jgi:hypothetical protein
METNTVQQEILLIKKSSFCLRQRFEKYALEKKRNLPYEVQLETACWNGWLDTVFPEIIITSGTGERLYIWDITQAKVFLSIELCEHPQMIDIQYSINPYAFLACVCYM